MHRKLAAAAFVLAAAPTLAQDAPPPPPKPNAPLPTPKMSAEECKVWNRERSFAQSVADHDAEAFKRHLHPGAVFFGGAGPDDKLVGPDAVAKGWGGIIADGDWSMRWYPRRVVIAPGTDVAHSAGFYWMVDKTPGAKQPYAIGQFASIWTKVDGEWKVVFDGGGGGQPRAATQQEVEAIKASLAKQCPAA